MARTVPCTERKRKKVLLPEYPDRFSLLAPLNVHPDSNASEIAAIASRRDEGTTVFLEPDFTPPRPIPRPTLPLRPSTIIGGDLEQLRRKTPMAMIRTREEAFSSQLEDMCQSSDIFVVRGLADAVGVDLSKFCTDTLMDVAPDQEIETRIQEATTSESTWMYMSRPGKMTLREYARYQAEQKRKEDGESASDLENECPPSKRGKQEMSSEILFGTNFDLTDEKLFYTQLTEIEKLPPVFALHSRSNLLTLVDTPIPGMNRAQVYIKVAGAKTPGHQENNSFCSININIGPGDCEWFGVPDEYWGVISEMVEERMRRSKPHQAYMRESWWPSEADLMKAGVPIYRFTQKAGDLVYVGAGCVHWVQALSSCNNVSWNVGPMTARQYNIALRRYDWNRQIGYQSLVPMEHLSWELAKRQCQLKPELYILVREVLIRSVTNQRLLQHFIRKRRMTVEQIFRELGDPVYACVCGVSSLQILTSLRQMEVFNVLFIQNNTVFCVRCAQRVKFNEFTARINLEVPILERIFDSFHIS